MLTKADNFLGLLSERQIRLRRLSAFYVFQENGQYRCAVYLRLSRSDGDQQESNSIKNQRALLNDYMGKHPELHKFDEYVDDGYSGTNFVEVR